MARLSAPNYSGIFSGTKPPLSPSQGMGTGAVPQQPIAGSMGQMMQDFKEFRTAFPEMGEKDILPFAIFMQQRQSEIQNDPSNITRQMEALEGPLARIAQGAANISAQKDMRSMVGGLFSKLPDTMTQALGAKFAYDQPVFNAINATYNPNPYAYGVLNRRGGAG
jgi:hypothetical protein